MTEDMFDCISDNELLSWVSGALPEERTRALDAHLDSCEHCQALVGQALRDSNDSGQPRRRGETFRENELVSGRYRVVRFIARGGMGEVYEVDDLWLKHRVALKTVVASIADDPAALARLKAEVLIARQVSHPNVCRIFDLGFHEPPSSGRIVEGERVAFLTMELLRGETLRAKLRREGRLASNDARPIALQMIAGLSRAHDAGVIHRDFKSDNVILVEEAGGVRAVITDFGLARSLLLSSMRSSTGGAMGTLDYMAPEQVLGSPVTQRADIFALGVVLFEMVTGRLPFDGESAATRALLRTQVVAPRPSKFVPEIDGRWEATIMSALAKDPSTRPERADELRLLLEGERKRPGVARPVFWALVASAFVLVALIGGAVARATWSVGNQPVISPAETSSLEQRSPAAPAAESMPTSIPAVPPAALATASHDSSPVVSASAAPPAASQPRPLKRKTTATDSKASGSAEEPAHAANGLLDPFKKPARSAP